MKKVDVITIHRNCNYGSVLQTFATQSIFQEMGFECETIDYIRELDTKRGLLSRLKNKSEKLAKNPLLLNAAKVAIYPSYVKKERVFNKFLNTYVHLTPRQYYSNADLISDCPLANAYCTGSDQIWNSHWNEGVERAYYLDFVKSKALRFSYSSSIGKEKIGDTEAYEIKPMLEQYAFLSVREGKSVKTLKDMGFDDVQQVLDPTLYRRSDFWRRIATDESGRKPYIVTYNLHHDKKLDRYTWNLAKKKGLDVINISYNWHDIRRKGKLAWCPSVEEYLGLIKDAQYVIADSFHATAFSIQFHKQFITFYPEQASVRMRDLLQVTGIQDRGVDKIPPLGLIDKAIDYRDVDQKLDDFRKNDSEFLRRIAVAIEAQENK